MLPFNKSQIVTYHFNLNTFSFTLLLGHHLLLVEADFHKVKDREICRKTHNDLKITNSNAGLTELYIS
jgi:hypothetical protein